jgi:hypothetical protein
MRLTKVLPSEGPTSGLTLLEISGSGFPIDGTVAVLVGGARASLVAVPEGTRILCVTPRHDSGLADVVVVVGSESATLPQSFTYLAPDLAVETDLTRVVRTLLLELRRQVLANVVLTTSTDYAAPGAEAAELSRLPGLVLLGPTIPEDRFYSLNALPEDPVAPGVFRVRREPYTVDLEFGLTGVTDRTTDLLNLLAATGLFFHKNTRLVVARDPDDPSAGSVGYEMALTADLRVASEPNNSNVRHFTGSFVIRGFDLDDPHGIPLSEGQVADGGVALTTGGSGW